MMSSCTAAGALPGLTSLTYNVRDRLSRVTETSNAMDVASGTFAKRSPRAIAREVEHDAETSTRRKSTPYRSAMSMLTFYINRAGKNLSPERRKILEQAKDVLREEFGPERTRGRSRKR